MTEWFLILVAYIVLVALSLVAASLIGLVVFAQRILNRRRRRQHHRPLRPLVRHYNCRCVIQPVIKPPQEKNDDAR